MSVGAVIGSGLLTAPVPASESAVNSAPLRAALVGCGRQGRTIINAGLKIPNLRFAALCDIQPTALKSAKLFLESEDVETAGYSDCREMFGNEKGKIDAVIIASPDCFHTEQTLAALEVGLHVYCEAPMAVNAEDARKMLNAAKSAKRFLQIGFVRRSDPRYRHTAEKLLNPDSLPVLIGKITHFETQANRRIHSELIWSKRDTLTPELLDRYGFKSMEEYRNWREFRKYGSGACLFYLAQQLDVFQWFFNIRPSKIQAMGGLDYYKFGNGIDNVSALLAYPFPQGMVRGISRVWTTTSGGGNVPFEHIFGEFGSLQTSLSESAFRVHAEPGLAKWSEFVRRGDLKKENAAAEGEDPNLIKVRETGNVVPYLVPLERPDSVFRLHLSNFVNTVFGKENLHCSGEDAFPSHIIAWKVAEAVESSTSLELTEEMFRV